MNVSTHYIGLLNVVGRKGQVAKLPPETVHVGNHELVKGDSVLFGGDVVESDGFVWIRRENIITATEA